MPVSEELKQSYSSGELYKECEMSAHTQGGRLVFSCGNTACADVVIESQPVGESLEFTRIELGKLCPNLQQQDTI